MSKKIRDKYIFVSNVKEQTTQTKNPAPKQTKPVKQTQAPKTTQETKTTPPKTTETKTKTTTPKTSQKKSEPQKIQQTKQDTIKSK